MRLIGLSIKRRTISERPRNKYMHLAEPACDTGLIWSCSWRKPKTTGCKIHHENWFRHGTNALSEGTTHSRQGTLERATVRAVGHAVAVPEPFCGRGRGPCIPAAAGPRLPQPPTVRLFLSLARFHRTTKLIANWPAGRIFPLSKDGSDRARPVSCFMSGRPRIRCRRTRACHKSQDILLTTAPVRPR